MQTSSYRNKAALIKKVFGENPNTQAPIATLNKNTIVPINSTISYKYTFILETLIDINQHFSVADHTATKGLFACLLAQDFEDSVCHIITKDKSALKLYQQVQQTFKIKNLQIQHNSPELITDITLHDILTIEQLNNKPPQELAQQIATSTTKYTIIDIPSENDTEARQRLQENFKQVNTFWNHLLNYYWIITLMPIVYNENSVRACYLLEKK